MNGKEVTGVTQLDIMIQGSWWTSSQYSAVGLCVLWSVMLMH